MDRQQIKNSIIQYFKGQIPLMERPGGGYDLQMGFLMELFRDELNKIPSYKQKNFLSAAKEIVHEFIIMGALYPGAKGAVHGSDSEYPWITITEYGREIFTSENWLPYDPDGYVNELKLQVPDLDDVTLSYIAESVAAFNRRYLLSATITLGVASENLMLLLIEAYTKSIKDPVRQSSFRKKTEDKWISTQYKVFKKEFPADVKSLGKELQSDWETYLDGIFNFIRLNRNDAGHPTGKELSAKVVNANLQIFAEYAKYVCALITALK
jgi:hypothetical protein